MSFAEPAQLSELSTEELVETLPDVPGRVIDQLDKEERLAPKPDVDPSDIERRARENGTDVILELGKAMKPLPRSQRVQVAFEFRPTDYQALLLDYPELVDRAQVAPKAGRQVGKTKISGYVGADHALTNRNTDILYTAPGQDTADEMFKEFKDAFRHGPFTLEQYGVKPGEDNKQTWEFTTGTRAMSRTLGAVGQDKNPGNRGMSPSCVIVDEAHYEQDKVYTEEIEEFFITHEKYEYYLFSTPAGKSGYFYQNVDVEGHRTRQEAAEDSFGWYAPYWPTKISPFAQQDFIEQKRKEYDTSTFEQEFEGKFAEDGDSAIPHSTLNPNIDPEREFDTDQPRYLGVDPARGGDDEMVAFDIDASGTFWNAWSFETISGPQFVEFLESIHTGKDDLEYWPDWPSPTVGTHSIPSNGYATILIEENGVGGFAADFAEAGLGSVIKVVNSTNETKQNVYQRLIKDLEQADLKLPKHKPLIRQTTAMQKSFTPTGKAKYEAPPGKHDDWPDGMAFANWARHGNGEDLDTKPANQEIRRRRGDQGGRRRITR
jgi:hypothetical protein